MIAGALLLLAAAAPAAAAPAPAQPPMTAAAVAAPVDFSGLWVVSNKTRNGPLDEQLQPIKGNIYTPKAAAARAKVKPALDPSVMCLPSMPRHLGGPYPIQIVQSGGKLAMLFEWDTVFRLIHIGSTAHPDPDVETRWMGHSIGRWEGRTLVIETANFNGKAWMAGDGTPQSDKAKLTEWLTLGPDGKTLNIRMKIEDPENLIRPIWRDYVFNQRNDWEIKEYVCAEGNRDNVFGPGGGTGSLEKDDVIEQ